jgi:hypothetical protein
MFPWLPSGLAGYRATFKITACVSLILVIPLIVFHQADVAVVKSVAHLNLAEELHVVQLCRIFLES